VNEFLRLHVFLYFHALFAPKSADLMLRKLYYILLALALTPVLRAQTYLPATHAQQHSLPRGAYVACVDDILTDMTLGDRGKFQDLKKVIRRHKLQFLAFYGLHRVLDGKAFDNPEEVQLRIVINELRQEFPNLKLGAVGGGRSNPAAGKINAQEFENLRTDRFLLNTSSEDACPNSNLGTLGSAKLNRMMNPINPDPNEQYQAEVIKFFARVASTYGFAAPESRGLKGSENGKTNTRDYFDHLVLEDEWWWRQGAVRSNLDDHEALLVAMRSILHLSHACEAKVITYESIQRDITGVSPMSVQASEIAALADRVYVTHYFKCVPNTLERYCEAIEAWGQVTSGATELWPLFSSEDASAKVSCTYFDPSLAWNDFWGEWMDTTYTASNPPPIACPNPGRAGFGYPYEVAEAEDLYLIRLDSASKAQALPLSACPSFQAGNFKAEGFMWFIAHLMDPHDRSNVSVAEVEADFLQEPMVFPNPAASSLRITKGEIKGLSTLSGQQLPIESQGDQLNLSQLPAGMYILKVLYEDQEYFLRFYRE